MAFTLLGCEKNYPVGFGIVEGRCWSTLIFEGVYHVSPIKYADSLKVYYRFIDLHFFYAPINWLLKSFKQEPSPFLGGFHPPTFLTWDWIWGWPLPKSRPPPGSFVFKLVSFPTALSQNQFTLNVVLLVIPYQVQTWQTVNWTWIYVE